MEDKIRIEQINLNHYQSIITYVTDSVGTCTSPTNPVSTVPYALNTKESAEVFNDTYPQFFTDVTSITIPQKLKRHLQRNIPLNLLRKIDKEKDIAIEKCLIIASNLTPTLFSEDNEKWKPLHSKILNEQIKKGNDNTFLYKYAIDVLKYTSNSTNPVVEVKQNYMGNDIYQEGICSKQFKFTSNFSNCGTVNYSLKVNDCIEKRRKLFYKNYAKAISNTIGSNLVNLYSLIELPTLEDMKNEAKRLIKINHRTKKGKALTFLNHRPKEQYEDFENRSFVEDNIKSFQYLTSRGFMIPVIGNEKSGGRVYDSLNLMPSWIRKLIKIDGEPIVEIDFRALHPNIAMSIYGGQKKYITHQQIAEESGVDISTVKIENLSFFNKEVIQMKNSTLYNYYLKWEPEMIEKIIEDKYNSIDKHRITSKKLFKKEVDIMTNCIRRLNNEGIYVGYVFDALFCKQKDSKIVNQIMNEEALNRGVYTTAKHE